MLCQMTDHMDGDTIAGQVISLIVGLRQLVVLVQAHEPRGLARGYEPAANLLSVDNEDNLTAGAPGRRAQTARNVVEPDLGALDFDASIIDARPFINAAHHAPA